MMTAWSRVREALLGALLPGALLLVFFRLQTQQAELSETLLFRSLKQLDANAQAHAGGLGVFAGFIAAVVVIFLSRESDPAEDMDVRKAAATGVFLCAFLHAVLGAFQYASFTGFPAYWKGLPGVEPGAHMVVFPTYLFDLLGIEYLLAVYLGFYGLLLTVRYSRGHPPLIHLARFMLMTVYVLGSTWVFMDFAVSRPPGSSPFPFWQLGLLYTLPVVAAGMLSVGRFRPSPDRAVIVLYGALVWSLLLAVALGTWYACLSFSPPGHVVPAQVEEWTRASLWLVASALFILFVLLTVSLNGLLSDGRAEPQLRSGEKASTGV